MGNPSTVPASASTRWQLWLPFGMTVVSAVAAIMTLVAVKAYRPYHGPWESAPKWFYFGVGVALTVSCFGVVLGAIWLRGQRDRR